MKLSRTRIFMIIGIIVPELLSGTAFGQDPENVIPELNGHVFVHMSNLKYPFTNTSFTTNLGIGSAKNLSYNIEDINGQPVVGIKGDITYASLSFDYTQKIQDWIAMYLYGGLTARLGTNVFSLLSQGVSTVSVFRIGWIVRIAEGEKFALSATAGLNNSSGTFINVKKFAEDIVNNVPDPSITTDVPILLGDFGVQFAYGFNQVIGLDLDFNLSYGESFDRGKSELRYAAKGAVDFNFIKYRIPVGLVLGGSLVSQPEIVYTENKTAIVFATKVTYTGTKDFLLGVEINKMNIPLEGINERSSFSVGMISIRYYFN